MNLTAKEMHNSPAQAYREADKGNTVVINHDRYPDKVFELTARDRNPLRENSPVDYFYNLSQRVDRFPNNVWTKIIPEK